MASADSAGIMSGAFFVGKTELLKWLNDFFQIGYTKVEECASGAIHCQILDSIFPGQVPLHKVNFGAKYEHEFVPNYKVLQNVFEAQGIKKHVDVDKLIKAKYQDNLEFLQWMKHLWDQRYNSEVEYDAVARRESSMKKKAGGKLPVRTAAAADHAERKGATSAKPKPAVGAKPTSAAPKKPAVGVKPAAGAKKPAAAAAAAPAEEEEEAAPPQSNAGSNEQVEHLNQKITKMRITMEGLEKERNFYFGKLREIEVLCTTDEDKDAETKATILQILYKTDEDFEQPADASEAAPADAPAEDEVPADEEPVQEAEEDLATY